MPTTLPRLKCISLLNCFPKQTLTNNNIKQIHAQLITNNLNSPKLFSKLTDYYSSTSSNPNILNSIFYYFHPPHLLLFNTLIKCTPFNHSIHIFKTHFSKQLIPFDHNTFNFILGACARSPSYPTLKLGTQLHSLIIKQGFGSNVLVPTTLIHFYANNRDIKSARKVFDEMPDRNVVTWNAMITGYCSLKDGNEKNAVNGLCLFKEMLMVGGSEVRPNDTTVVCLLSAASQLGMVEIGVCLHGFAVKVLCKVEDDVFIGTGLVDMYSKCGCLESALSVFRRMKWRNVLTWTAMTTGLAIHGRGEEALKILYEMGSDGVKPNETTFTSLLSACCHAGLVEEGLQLFRDMEGKFGVVPWIQHYGCVVDLLGRNGNLNEAYDFIMEMPISPDTLIWRSLLSACRIHGDVVMGEKVGRFLLKFKEKSSEELAHKSEDYVALSNVYASAGRWDVVEVVRKKMKVKGICNQSGLSSVQTLSNDTL
ncbi:putative pentatricopeptide [Medicago truncatula]|uniref:Putative pentatricopeptide n=1 Tax=Medicago truncatula TaxID=3880 RepID=A0A396II61_MEDTR|nr:pentatricopeptide repeat-containing protein At3g18970 [Medicago truncatula]RHN65366.1 putative pentatricopeptide [Medicago truncatula]